MSKQILLSLLNCSWQWMLLSGLIWFAASSRFHKSRRSKTTVHLLWLLSLLSLPILFGLNQFMPAPSIGGTAPELTQAKPVNVSGLDALTADLPEISSVEGDTQSNNRLFAGTKFFFNWIKTDLLLWAWTIGALAMLARFMFGLYRIYQLRRRAVVADDSYQTICQRFAQQLDIKHPVTVCFSDRVASPISFGWLSPHILIPRNLNLEQFELVAAHELAHVQRLDWLTNLFSHVVGVIFFFHPVYHFLNRELIHLRERICDDWVIQLTGDRKNYAQCLLDLVRHRDRAIPLALSLNQPSQLESRIDAILKSNRRLDVQLKPRLRLIITTLLLTCLPLLAMAQLVPLKTFQISLFAQTPEKSEEAVDRTAAVEEWLNEESTDEERMQRDRQRMEQEGARNNEQYPSREELAKRLDKEDSDFENSLADAIRNGDIEAIKQHITDGVDVNELFFETPPLAWAALMGQTEAAALLLQHCADINDRNRDGNTALHLAVFLGRAETAELLLKNEADVNAKNYDGLTPVDFLRIPWEITKSTLKYLDVELKQEQLEAGKAEIWEMFRADAKRSAKPNTQDAPTNLWTAASVGDIQTIKRYIKKGGDVDALDREFHLPAMSWGALHGQTEVVRFLIKSGADVNRKSEDDNTPLHSAAFFGRTNIAKLLLKHGADIKARNDDGATPADVLYVDWQTTAFIGDLVDVEVGKAEILAMKRGRFEVAKLFGVEYTYAAQNLLEAAFISDLAAVKQALTDGGNPNARDLESGTTVLATAALMGHTKVVAMLLEHGADVNAKSPDGSTALHAAAFLGRAETVWLLLEKGADATIRNKDGATPLDVTKADWEITEYLADQLQIEIDEAEINIRRSEVVKLISQHNGNRDESGGRG